MTLFVTASYNMAPNKHVMLIPYICLIAGHDAKLADEGEKRRSVSKKKIFMMTFFMFYLILLSSWRVGNSI